ncbi:MAG: radical SAM protein [Clostridia bacterium]|nr:radical SAM protein [Clostridia bacterium]
MSLFKEYDECRLCPRQCGVNRNEGQTGFCGMPAEAVVNLIMHHFGEEPVISGISKEKNKGSGTVFFEGCQLRCAFCQNHSISRGETFKGRRMSSEQLAEEYLKLQEEGAYNINLVTASHFLPVVAESLRIAKERGLIIPVVYNNGGYERAESLKLLDGLVDIYMPDMKYFSSKLSGEVAAAPDYFERATEALAEMYRQVGKAKVNADGIMEKGIIVRHLMLPGELFDTRKILDYLIDTYGNNVYISLMCQYTPCCEVIENNTMLSAKMKKQLSKTLNPKHYETMVDYIDVLGQENAFCQEFEATGNELLPDFVF